MGDRSQMTQGMGGHGKQTVGDIKQWEATEGGSAWEYMIINVFYKHWPRRGGWIGMGPEMVSASRYIISMASFWFLFFLHSLPPLYIKPLGSNGSAVIFISRHGDVICIIEVE